jgi:hypothetical protein
MTYKNQATKLAEAKQIAGILAEMDERLPEELHSSHLAEIISEIEQASVRRKQLKTELDAAIEAQKQKRSELKVFMKRLRSGVKAVFGDDSLEYERVGGKRRSEYKRRTRNETVSAAATSESAA